jgi:hypothetical protein
VTALSRRSALGRLALVAAGTLAVLARPEPVSGAPEAPAPDSDLYHGDIWTITSDEPGAGVDSETIAALLIHTPRRENPVRMWVNVELVSPDRRAAVETWARRQIGAGKLFGLLDVDELALI